MGFQGIIFSVLGVLGAVFWEFSLFVIVDKGYHGVDVPDKQILRFRQRRGVTRTLRKMIKRRSAIEPATTIGHMKMDGRLGRNPLKGALGDALHAVLCGSGHNISLLLKKLRLLSALTWQRLIAALLLQNSSLKEGGLTWKT